MPVRIALASQKGGTGKTTLARALAVAFAQSEWSVKICDFDKNQLTATKWFQRRLQRDTQPELAVEPFGNVGQAVSKTEQLEAVIFDGAAFASIITADMAKASDLVIIPTGLPLDDLEPAAELAEELRSKHGIPADRIVFALNHVGDSEPELADARDYLNKTRFKTLDGYLQRKTSYSRAHDVGLSVIETPHRGPREQAEKLVQSVMDKINEITN